MMEAGCEAVIKQFSSCLCLLLITSASASPAYTQLTETRVIAAKPGPAFNEAAHGGVGATTEADATLWCARLTSASAQELDCFWIINYRARFTPFACHSLHSPSLSFVCTQIPNVHFSFHTSLWAQSALAGLMIPSEMQMEAFEGERQLIPAFVCTKKKGNGCATIVSRAVSCPLCYGAMLFSAVLCRRIWRPLQRLRKHQDRPKRKETKQGAQEAAVSQE